MSSTTRFVLSAALVATVAGAFASDLAPGMKAPALEVKNWYKGKKVTAFSAKKTYVVEFWATWCGPCRDSIPHLTELAKKNKDVTFVGVSIWEDDKDGSIAKFVKEMGAKMDYNVGYSGNKTGMSKSWMEAAGQNGIPTAFVVKNQKVMWIGHPMELEKPLGEIKSGKFNLAKFKTEFAKEAAASKAEMARRKELDAAANLFNAGKYAEATKKLDEIDKKAPEFKSQTESLRFAILGKTDPEKWQGKANALATSSKDGDKETLCMYALEQVQTKGDMEHAHIAIDLALSNAKEGDCLVYYYGASFYDSIKTPQKALDLIEKALEALPKSSLKDNKAAKEALTKIRDDYAKKVK